MRISDWSSDVCSSDLVGLVRDRQAAADVDGVDRTDAVGETCQLGVDLAPVRRRDDATAQVRMDVADACIELPGLAYEGIERRQRQPELRRRAAGDHLGVVSVAAAQVDAQ